MCPFYPETNFVNQLTHFHGSIKAVLLGDLPVVYLLVSYVGNTVK